MRRLGEEDILRIWEIGREQSSLERARTILEQAYLDRAPEALSRLPVGRCDESLFVVRTWTFGRRIPSLVKCPACGEQLEFEFEAADLGISTDAGRSLMDQADEGGTFREEAYTLDYRLVTCADLAACRTDGGPENVRSELIRRCIKRATQDGIEIQAEELPDKVIDALAKHVSERDPYAHIEFDLVCPACETQWQSAFDIASYLWIEIDFHARRLLREVHILAMAYGWNESDILALSAARRNYYLEMVTV